MGAPKISVIVPVYKVEQYLPRCIDSILAQTFTDFELLLIDDGSPDNSGHICDEYAEKDSRIRVFHKENGGVSSARNVGIAKAEGEWISFVDADDWIPHNAYAEINLIMETEKADLYHWGFTRTDGLHEIHKRVPYNKQYTNVYKFIQTFNYHHMVWSYLFRKNWIIEQNILFPKAILYSEDQCFLLKYLSLNPVIQNVNKSLYCYFDNQSSACAKEIVLTRAEFSLKAALDFVVFLKQNSNVDFVIHAISQLFLEYHHTAVSSIDYNPIKSKDIFMNYYNDIVQRIGIKRESLDLLILREIAEYKSCVKLYYYLKRKEMRIHTCLI